MPKSKLKSAAKKSKVVKKWFPKKVWPKSKLKQTQIKLKIALVLLTIAWLVVPIIGAVGYLQYQQVILSFKAVPVYTTDLPLRYAQPASISFGTIDKLEVVTASITQGIWETSDTAATHLDTSARPGEGGNVVVYGHNRRRLFGSLRNLQIGQTILISTTEGKQFEYQVAEREIVSPDQIEAVLPTEFEVLTLYTCIGWLDSQRLIIRATPLSASN